MGEHSPLPFHRHELQTLAFIAKLRVNYRFAIAVALLVGIAIGMVFGAK